MTDLILIPPESSQIFINCRNFKNGQGSKSVFVYGLWIRVTEVGGKMSILQGVEYHGGI